MAGGTWLEDFRPETAQLSSALGGGLWLRVQGVEREWWRWGQGAEIPAGRPRGLSPHLAGPVFSVFADHPRTSPL